jgi:exonuclease III
MKIVTWNCRQGFEGKASHIFAESPDIAVIQECSRRSTEAPAFDGYSGYWIGDKPSRGMGVFWKRGWKVRPLWEPQVSDPRWITPFRVAGPKKFTLIAVWACQVAGKSRASYVGQIHRSLQEHPEWYAAGPVVMAGDFNSNAIWDKKRRPENHSAMVAVLETHGLVSAYHAIHGEAHGDESSPTFYLYSHADKPYHMDYIFIPIRWQKRMSVRVGRHCDWKTLSDHCPVTIEVSVSQKLSQFDIGSEVTK